MAVRFAVQPKQSENQCACAIQQPDNGGGDPRQHHHWHRHHPGNGFGRAQGKLLGHQFPYDQRSKGGEANDQPKADIIRPSDGQTKEHQPLRHRSAQTRAGISTRDNPDQRDANLHGG